MLQTIALLACMGMSVAAGVINSLASSSYQNAVENHNAILERCQRRLDARSMKCRNLVNFTAARATYIESIRAANAVWSFLSEERKKLSVLLDCEKRLKKDRQSAKVSDNKDLVASLQEVHNAIKIVRQNSEQLKANLQQLNQQTRHLREQFPQMGQAGKSYYSHLQQLSQARISCHR